MLEGKVAVITGGSRGIGRAIALKFAQSGADIILVYLRQIEKAKEVKEEIEKMGRRCIIVKANVAEPDDAKKISQEAEKMGKVDIVVSNAASGVLRPFWETDLKHFRWTMEINSFGLINVVKNLLPLMVEGSRVIVISSLGAQRAIPNYSLVGASKGALESLIRHLALELAPRKILVNGISPGVVDTDALKHFPNREELIEESKRRTPLGRLTTPEDVANVALFLASPLSDFITGEVIQVDGGYSIVA